MTLRSNDQFNMTIYGYEDRLRDVSGTRDIVFMNPADIEQFGLFDGKVIGLATEADDAIIREKHGSKVFCLRRSAGLYRRLLSRMQRAHSAIAPCGGKQSSRRQVGACPHHPIMTSMGTDAVGPRPGQSPDIPC
jgi:hypothetical protein